jgi:hypothetical protein
MRARIAALLLIVFASQMMSACSRIVSVEPLLPANSAPGWDGAYAGAIDVEKRGTLPFLLQLQHRGDGAYDFTIHSGALGKDLFQPSAPLNLVGRGEVRIADLGDSLAVAQTRCEIAMAADPKMQTEFRTLADMIAVAKRFGAMGKNEPRSNYLGPFVYTLLRGSPARVDAIMGLDEQATIKQAAEGTSVEVDKWEGGVGDGMLIGSNLIFESDDLHVSSKGAPGAALPFFARLAHTLFAKADVKNTMAWTRVAPDKLAKLHLENRYPPAGQAGGWCNLYLAVPKDR